jgi:hypothetical protein
MLYRPLINDNFKDFVPMNSIIHPGGSTYMIDSIYNNNNNNNYRNQKIPIVSTDKNELEVEDVIGSK